MNASKRHDDFISPEYGRRLLPVELDRIAKTDPKRPFFARVRNPTDLAAAFEDISYHRISNAVNRTAHWLRKELGAPKDFQTLAYLAAPDIRNVLLMFAVSKVGFKLLLLSPRNSIQANVNLFDLTRCNTVIVTDPPAPFARAFLAHNPMNTFRIPALDQLLAEDEVPPYPFSKSFDEAKNDPVLVLHTSGSTGLPKPIIWTHGFFAAADNMMQKTPPLGKQSAVTILRNARLLNTTPGFHAAGIGTMTFFAVWLGCCSILPPPSSKPIDASTIVDILKYANASSMLVVPSILEDMSKDSTLSDALHGLSFVIYSGGALPREAGDQLKNKTHVTSYIGATEFAIFPHLINKDPDDWEYVSIDPCYNIDFRQNSPDLYEAVMVRSVEWEKYQPVWHIYPQLREYHTNDLYSKHPTKSDLWMYRGRMDDIIVLVNGEKLNPVTIEGHVSSHKEVKSALVLGEGRFQVALLVEPIHPLDTTAEKARLLENIWPLIMDANEASPAHGRISRDLVFFTSSAKPMLRAGKGTVQRRSTLTAYAKEIDALYADADSLVSEKLRSPVDDEVTRSSLEPTILHMVKKLAAHNKEIGPDDDIFSHGGMDSLQVLQLVRYLRARGVSTKEKYDTITPSMVYNNPTASLLAKAITTSTIASQERMTALAGAKIKEMQDLLVSLSGARKDNTTQQPETIMLTGSTGSLGFYLLDSLLGNPHVEKIYCVDRAASEERQADINASRGLSAGIHTNKAEVHKANILAPRFGLDEATFETISTTVTRIIHCAWPVDFNLSLQSFLPQLQGVRALLDFAASPQYPRSIFFISSIASVGSWAGTETVPELALSDFSLPSPTGYAQSKFLAEQLLLNSASLVDVSICRVGQIAGPVLNSKGAWKKDEWLPSLIKSSNYLKLLPESLGSAMEELDWIPVDLLSMSLVELALLPREKSATVYHTVNPHSCSWKTLLPPIRDALGGKEVEIVPFNMWVQSLRHSAPETFKNQAFDDNPAIKLLDFFEGFSDTAIPKLSTIETQRRSEVLREMRAIEPGDMERWLRQWGF